jgi:hypothetical protein
MRAVFFRTSYVSSAARTSASRFLDEGVVAAPAACEWVATRQLGSFTSTDVCRRIPKRR